jgi:CHAD domain-containing protein
MTWRFEPGEGLRAAFRRVSAEEIAKVRSGLTAPEVDRDKAIHEARQAFKRLRALVRLAKPPLGADFAGENRRWRDAGRLLSGSRDTTVLLQCFDRLVADRGADLPADQVERLRARIAGKGAGNGATDVDENVRQVLVLLDDAEASVAELDWPNSKAALLHGFHRGQKRLRRDWKEACKESAPDALHSWRKRVKDQAAQLRLFRLVTPGGFRARCNDEKETAELLGDEHDLWLLSERLRAESMPGDLSGIRDLLLEEIEQRRSTLRRQAFKKGEAFSAQKAKAFAGSIGTAWDKASKRKIRTRRRKRANGSAEAEAISPTR